MQTYINNTFDNTFASILLTISLFVFSAWSEDNNEDRNDQVSSSRLHVAQHYERKITFTLEHFCASIFVSNHAIARAVARFRQQDPQNK